MITLVHTILDTRSKTNRGYFDKNKAKMDNAGKASEFRVTMGDSGAEMALTEHGNPLADTEKGKSDNAPPADDQEAQPPEDDLEDHPPAVETFFEKW